MISVQADAKTTVSVGAGMVVGGTNAAAGIHVNINNKTASKMLSHFRTFLECLQSWSKLFGEILER